MGLKILFNSTAPWGGSSYSVLSKRVVPEIVRLGHNVIMNTWYGLQGEPQAWPIAERYDKTKIVGNVQIFPSVNSQAYGTDTMLEIYKRTNANCLITNQDVWVVPAAITQQTNFVPWCPIDHDPAPPGVLASLAPAKYVMVYSRWGVEVLAKAGIEAHYVPCSAPTDVYKPLNLKDARQKLGIPESCDFLATMVAANKDPDDRKGLANAMTGFARFAQKHPNALLYMHTNWAGPVDISMLVKQLGLQNRVVQCDQLGYWTGTMNDDYMRTAYSASDVLLNPAKSEGFGLPLLEAQMCGCPIAATDYSTTDELLFAGWKIKTQPNWTVGGNSFRCIALIDSIVDALEDAYSNKGNELLRRQARKGAQKYDCQFVAEKYWKPALAEVEDIIEGGSRGTLSMVTF